MSLFPPNFAKFVYILKSEPKGKKPTSDTFDVRGTWGKRLQVQGSSNLSLLKLCL